VNQNIFPSLIAILLVLEIVFLGLYIAFGKIQEVETVVEKLLILFFTYYIATHYYQLGQQFYKGFMYIVNRILPSTAIDPTQPVHFSLSAKQIMNDPGCIINWAHQNIISKYYASVAVINQTDSHPPQWSNQGALIGFIQNAFNSAVNAANYVSDLPGRFMDLFGNAVLFGILTIVCEVAFAILAIDIVIAQVEFYIVLLIGTILVPFLVWQPLRFLGSKAITALVGQTIRLAVILITITVGMHVMDLTIAATMNNPADLSIQTAVIFMSLLLVFLAFQVPALAMSFITGNPGLNAGGFLGNMAAIGSGIASIGMAAFTAGGSLAGAARSGGELARGVSQPAVAVNATGTTTVSSTPTSGGLPSSGARGLFSPVPSSPAPAGGGSGSGAQTSKVNPLSSETKTGTATKQPADRMFQPVSSNQFPKSFSSN
jgi:P-type conjugative transfer protein TrbL